MCVCVCVGRVAYFNLWGQVIFLDIINEVMSELKFGGYRERIIVMGTQSDFYF